MGLMRIMSAGAATFLMAFAALPADAAVIPSTSETGDFTFSTVEDITQSGPLVVGGTANISGNNVTLDDPGNDFASGVFAATGALTVVDNTGLSGSFFADGSAQVQSASTLFIDALNIGGSASLSAFTGTDFSDVVILNAQKLFVGGTLEITAESIIFDFSDGGTADLARLEVGGLLLTTNIDNSADTTVIASGVSVTSSGSPVVIPLPASFGLALAGLGALVGLSRARRVLQAR